MPIRSRWSRHRLSRPGDHRRLGRRRRWRGGTNLNQLSTFSNQRRAGPELVPGRARLSRSDDRPYRHRLPLFRDQLLGADHHRRGGPGGAGLSQPDRGADRRPPVPAPPTIWALRATIRSMARVGSTSPARSSRSGQTSLAGSRVAGDRRQRGGRHCPRLRATAADKGRWARSSSTDTTAPSPWTSPRGLRQAEARRPLERSLAGHVQGLGRAGRSASRSR